MALELTSLICELHYHFVIAILEGIVVVGAVLGSWGKVNVAVNDMSYVMSHIIVSYVTTSTCLWIDMAGYGDAIPY